MIHKSIRFYTCLFPPLNTNLTQSICLKLRCVQSARDSEHLGGVTFDSFFSKLVMEHENEACSYNIVQ